MDETPEQPETPGSTLPAPDAASLIDHQFVTEAPVPASSQRRRNGFLVAGAAAIALGLGIGGFAVGAAVTGASTSSSNSSQAQPAPGSGSGGTRPNLGGPSTSGTSLKASAATDAQKVGVVTIVSNLYYDGTSQAAGTGIILTSGGEILTNNHVIAGSTSIKVTVESTGKVYTADVVGTDATADVAVLQLVNASGLSTARIDTSPVTTGETVTSIGNAEGTGNLLAATGPVTALDQSITVTNELTGKPAALTGLIEIAADVVSGDSGGPLIVGNGDVTGIVTAASSGSRTITGYAIPIATALDVAKQIEAGTATSDIVIGLPPFLGVELATAQTGKGVTIGGIIAGQAASKTALKAGDIITAYNGTTVTTTDGLTALVMKSKVGDSVTLAYTDVAGASHTATVVLAEGPAK